MRQASYSLMMFAAGFGTRMAPLTNDTPKPLLKVAGKPLIDHAFDLAKSVDPVPIVTNVHYLRDQIEAHFTGTEVVCLREAPDILDTGGGLKNALPYLGSAPCITTNTDAIWLGPNPFGTICKHWQPEEMDALLLCVPVSRVHGRQSSGDFDVDPFGRPSRRGDFVFGGIQIIKPETLAGIEDNIFSLNVVWDELIDVDRLRCAIYPGRWCDVGTPDGLDLAESLLSESENV